MKNQKVRKQQIDVSNFLRDPLMVATGCSWRRILTESGNGVCVPTNSTSDNQPDLNADIAVLQLFSASPELYEATSMLLIALEKSLAGESFKNADEIVSFAIKALEKAEKTN